MSKIAARAEGIDGAWHASRHAHAADFGYIPRMTSHRLVPFAILSLVLSLGACEQGSTSTDTGASSDTTPLDAPVAIDAPSAIDAPVAPSDDAFDALDGTTSGDAPAPGEIDAAVVESDGGFRGDAGSIGAGECDMRAECPPTCFRPVTCVKECGGPETECGCCPCAPGSIDAISCGATD